MSILGPLAAVGVARQLPTELAEALLEVNRKGFVHRFHLVAGISVVIAIVAAVIAVAMPCRVPAGTEEAHEEPLSAQVAGQ